MIRLTAGIVVMAAIAVAIAGCGSGAESPRPRAVAAVKATPRLKRMLEAEIKTLRRAQPKAPLTPVRPLRVTPEAGTSCFVGGGCSEVPCQEFARAPAVLTVGTTAPYVPGARRRAPAPSCRHAAPKLVPVSGP